MPTELNGPPRPVSDVVRKSLDNLDRAHKIAREKLKAAAEVTRRFYDRGSRLHVNEYDVGEQAWLRIDQIREFGKLTDKFHGPYYIVSKWNSGTYRIARAEGEPPKIVHHDRMRKYLNRTDEPMPEYIRVMIDRFNKSKNTTTQTDWNQQETPDEVEIQPSPEVLRKIRKQQTTDDVIADSEPERQAQRAVRLCVVCGKAKFDVSGIFRMIFSDGICHICRGRI